MIDLALYDTDKSPTYLARYTREFGHLFPEEIALLELGVHRGGSLYLWRDLFPNGQIAGLDIHHVPIEDASGRIHFYQGPQQDRMLLDRIGAEVAPSGFDIIVDDCSHLGVYTRESFWHLFRHHLKPGGVYVVDDWGCAYWDHWHDGHHYTGNREWLGDFRSVRGPDGSGDGQRARRVDGSGYREKARRVVRRTGLAAKVPALLRPSLRKAFLQATFPQTRLNSHDYGMAGFVKQLVDAVAIRDIDRGEDGFDNGIEGLQVYHGQVFVKKRL